MCGTTPAVGSRTFQLQWVYPGVSDHDVDFEIVSLSLPVCKQCLNRLRSIRGLLSRIFPAWNKVGEIVAGTPVFTNEAFNCAFVDKNPHLGAKTEKG